MHSLHSPKITFTTKKGAQQSRNTPMMIPGGRENVIWEQKYGTLDMQDTIMVALLKCLRYRREKFGP